MKTIIKFFGTLILVITVFGCSKDDGPTAVPDPVQQQEAEEKPLTISEIYPAQGTKGTLVTIKGTNFGADPNTLQIFFNGVLGELNSHTDNLLVAIVPIRAGTGNVKVVVNEKYTVGPQFTYFTSTFVRTLSGTGKAGSLDGSKEQAQFQSPTGITRDAQGNLYIADSGNHRIRKITPDGEVSTFAGSTMGFKDGQGAEAKFNGPYGLTADGQGNIYVADASNHRIRKITPDGNVSTLAGSTMGLADGVGSAAKFYYPQGVVVDALGYVHIADTGNRALRKIAPDGAVTTPIASVFGWPTGIAIDKENTIYVVDSEMHHIWQIAPTNELFRLAGSEPGSADGVGREASFNSPKGIAVDVEGNVFVSDQANSKIRKINSDGIVTSYAGSSVGLTDGEAINAKFKYPVGVFVDTDGNVYVADSSNHSIRLIINE